MESDHVVLFESLHEMAVVDLRLDFIHVSAEKRTREQNGKLYPGSSGRRQRMVDRVIAKRRRDGRRSDSVQVVRALPVDVLEIEVVVVLRRGIGQRANALDAVSIADPYAREASAEQVAGKGGESVAIGNVVQ